MSPEEWADHRARVEKDLAKSASTQPVQAEHYGVAAGLLAATKRDEDRTEALRLMLYGPRYRGEALRRFADGIRHGGHLYGAVTDYVDSATTADWQGQGSGHDEE